MKRCNNLFLTFVIFLMVVWLALPVQVYAKEKVYTPMDKNDYTGPTLTKEFLLDLSDGKARLDIEDFLNKSDYVWTFSPDISGPVRIHKDDFKGQYIEGEFYTPRTYTKTDYDVFTDMINFPFFYLTTGASRKGGPMWTQFIDVNDPIVDLFESNWNVNNWEVFEGFADQTANIFIGYKNNKEIIRVDAQLTDAIVIEHDGKKIHWIKVKL